MQAPHILSRPSLSLANRLGYAQFLASNVICKRLSVAVLLGLLATAGHAESFSLPAAPTPVAVKQHVFGPIDLSLAGSVVITRALDWTSTTECLRRPYAQCHEVELPNSLVKNKAAFAGFELAMSAVSIYAQYELTKHGHRKLAWLGQAIDVGVMSHVDVRNYHLDTTPVVMGLGPAR